MLQKFLTRAIRCEIANLDSDYRVVWIPDSRTEEQRAYRAAVDDLKHAKQCLSSMLLHHGYVWDEKTPTGKLKKASGREHDAWLSGISFNETNHPLPLCFIASYKNAVIPN